MPPTVMIQSGPSWLLNSVGFGTANAFSTPLPAEKKIDWPRSIAVRWRSVSLPA